MALTGRMRRKIMKKRGIGYVSVFLLATLISWVLGRITELDWNFRDFLLDFYVYVLIGCIVFDAVMSIVRKIRGTGPEEQETSPKKRTSRKK